LTDNDTNAGRRTLRDWFQGCNALPNEVYIAFPCS